MEDFVHLHVHTYYSILDGQSNIQKLVDKAINDGMRGLAITDHGNMFGIKEFYNYCNKVNGKRKEEGLPPFKPILGCEMYVARNKKESKIKENGDMGGKHLIVLAKNLQGYKNLIKLVSRSWVDGFYMRPRTDHEDLERYHEGLIVCSACIAGEVPSKVLKGDYEGAREAARWFKRVFGDDYYLELQRHEVKDPSLRANRQTYPLQQKANQALLEIAKELDIKVVCTNDVHFIEKDDAEAHDHLICLSTNKDLNDPNRLLYTKQEWFKSKEEMNEVFGDLPEAMRNTCEILDKIELYSIDHSPIMPFYPIPEDFGTEEALRQSISEEDLFKEFTSDENGENQLPLEEGKKKIEKLGGIEKLYRIKFEADYLGKLAYDGAKKLYGDPLTDEVDERIKFELHIMKTMGFPGYFLIVQDFINTARNELGVMVGPGRGSAAGSVVAYCLGITKIDPIKYDLLFERFLNPDRISLPDIDTDFDDDGRGLVLEWVENKYGHENCAHIITYGTMATKNSLKDVARVERVPLDQVNYLCKSIPDKLPNDLKMNLTNAVASIPELKQAEESPDEKIRNTIKYAKKLEGTVRGTGVHACGFIICRDPISDWVPISVAEDKTDPGHKLRCTQYDGHVIEDTGLIKMDFLGLKTLSILKEAVDNIQFTKGIKIDLDNIPIDDALTYELYSAGKTIGTFQFESPGMQKHLRSLQPTVFEDLIAMNALYRPGPMDYIPDFIERKKDPSKIQYDIPCMEKYLKDTYGITVYQEQVMLLARQLAGFTRGQSDTLRKAMGKKLIAQMDKLETLFYEGGVKNGHDQKVLNKIWEDWKKFASYAFNKSHATCYSWVSFQTAYLKAHYPAEYMAAVLSRNLNNITEVIKFIDECRTLGIKVLGPDVNESRQKFSANKDGVIRFGLSAIKGMGDAAAQSIVEERTKNGPYKNIYDFIERVNINAVNKKALELLALSGALDGFKELKREQYLTKNAKGEPFIDLLVRYGQRFQSEQNQSQNSLFGGDDAAEIPHPTPPEWEEWSHIELLNRERDCIGIYLSAHPLDEFSMVINNLCNANCNELADNLALASKENVALGGIVTLSEARTTKKGLPCGFVTIEDFNGSGRLALFGEDWAKWQGMLQEGYPILVRGKSTQRFRNSDVYDFKVSDIKLLQTVRDTEIQKITLAIDSNDINENLVTDIITLAEENKGKVELCFQIIDKEHNTKLTMRSQTQGVDLTRYFMRYIEQSEQIEYHIN